MRRLKCGRKSQDGHPQKSARARHKARTKKGATTRSRATVPTMRHCADKARHTIRKQDKISILRGSQNILPDWDSPHEKLESLEFPQQKNCVQLLPTWNTMATARRQGTEGKKYDKTNGDKVETKQLEHKSFNHRSLRPDFIPRESTMCPLYQSV